MVNSLFDSKNAKRFDTIAKKKAKLHQEETKLVKEFLQNTTSETIYKVLDVVESNGHPHEKEQSRQIRNKYSNHEMLDFDDIITLDCLYKSNYKYCNNKDENNE